MDDVSEAGLYASDKASLELPLRARLMSAGALLIALALLAAVLAYWGWRWFGPAPVTLPTARNDGDPVRRIADAHFFGAAAPAASSSNAGVSSGDLRLLGVFAQRDGQGYALFRAGSRGAPF